MSDKAALNTIQYFTGRVVSGQWRSNHNAILETLKWQLLEIQRKLMKLKICYNIVNNVLYPPSVFTMHPSPSPRYPHSQITFRPLVSSLSHRFSFFFYAVIPTWISLPSCIVNSPTSNSFKFSLRDFLTTT